jgi:CRP-like cAMP-binding protein
VEITGYFIDEGQLVPNLQPLTNPEALTNPEPLTNREPLTSPEPLTGREAPAPSTHRQALIKTELGVLSRTSLEELSAAIPAWDALSADLMTRTEADRIAALQPALAGDATACYKEFLDKFPQIAARIPLSYLASYLGITPQSFSRIRQKLAKNAYRPAR